MNIYGKVLIAQCRNKMINIEVCGSSMYPEIKDGDIVSIIQKNQYFIGDVIVFIYEKKIIVHRIIDIVSEEYWCKGDNSFRLEKVNIHNVVGIVAYINCKKSKPCSREKVSDSYKIYLEYRNSGYNIKKVMESDVYKEYIKKYNYVPGQD